MNQVQAQVKQSRAAGRHRRDQRGGRRASSSVERVQAAQAARELAQKTARKPSRASSKSACRRTTTSSQSQRDLATAQNNELQAILNYRKALVELERLQQTTLQNLNVTVIDAGGGAATTTTTTTHAVRAGGNTTETE